MPNDFEQQMEREAEAIIESLIRKAQAKIAAAAKPKTDSREETLIEDMVALCIMEPLNQYELTAIKALIFYISETQRLPEKTICGLLEYKFRAENIESILRQDFHLVVECLVNLQDSGSMN